MYDLPNYVRETPSFCSPPFGFVFNRAVLEIIQWECTFAKQKQQTGRLPFI